MLEKSTQYWLRTIIVGIVAIVALLVMPVVIPFIVSFVLTLILLPIVNYLDRLIVEKGHIKYMSRSLAIIPAFVLVVLLGTLIFIHIIIPLVAELTKFVNNVPEMLDQFIEVLKELPFDGSAFMWTPQIDNLVNMAVTKIGNYSMELLQKGVTAVLSVAGTVLELFLVPIMTFYMLKDGAKLKSKVVNVFPQPVAESLTMMINSIHQTLGGYLRGQLLLATNMFCIVLIAMYIFEVPYPLVLAFLAGIAEWIPILGPFIAALPAIILASLISGSLAFKVAIFYVVMQVIDGQIIMPRLMGRVIKLHPLVIITVIFIGGSFYGILGMVIAVPLTAILQVVANKLWFYELYFNRKGE